MTTTDDLFAAISSGDRDVLETILAEDPAAAGARNEKGVSATRWALYHRQPEIAATLAGHLADEAIDVFDAAALGRTSRVVALVDAAPSELRAVSTDGFTPLHLACFFDRAGTVDRLLERGADVDAVAANVSRVQPLHSAVAGRSVAAVTALLEAGADANARQHGGWTALHAAAKHGLVDAVRTLLAHGADPTAAVDDGSTALDLASDPDVRAILDA